MAELLLGKGSAGRFRYSTKTSSYAGLSLFFSHKFRSGSGKGVFDECAVEG